MLGAINSSMYGYGGTLGSEGERRYWNSWSLYLNVRGLFKMEMLPTETSVTLKCSPNSHCGHYCYPHKICALEGGSWKPMGWQENDLTVVSYPPLCLHLEPKEVPFAPIKRKSKTDGRVITLNICWLYSWNNSSKKELGMLNCPEWVPYVGVSKSVDQVPRCLCHLSLCL